MARLFTNEAGHVYGDFRDDLERDGFAVIKGAIPRERADVYAEAMFKWLEDLYVFLPDPLLKALLLTSHSQRTWFQTR